MSSPLLQELLNRVQGMAPEQVDELKQMVSTKKFYPTPGPQMEAYHSKADVMLYGGAGGGGKSALGVGLALTNHHRSLILRRRYNDLSALTDEAIKFNGTREGFSSAPQPKMRTEDGKLLEFGACQHLGDEEAWRGRPHDYIYFDEVTQFLEQQVRFIMAWNRTTGDNPGQRCRVVFGSNPPTSAEGAWIIDMFAPWIDPNYPNPAKPGELRYVVSDEHGKDRWVDGPAMVMVGGRMVIPISRTFVGAKLADNPFLASTDYASKLDALHEPLRSAMRDGNFMTARQDDDLQVIPSEWVRAAQLRWTPSPPMEAPMCAIGCDPAMGGNDETVLAPRYDGWYAPLIVRPGESTPSGRETAALIIQYRSHNAKVIIDVGGGYGDAAFEILRANLDAFNNANQKSCIRFDGASASTARAAGKTMGFANKRAEAWWRFREALDPSQEGGSSIMLPPDARLLADLTSPRLDDNVLALGKIKIESKPDLKKRLGRSPDRGDAVIMAWSEGNKALTHAAIWKGHRDSINTGGNSRPKVVMGHDSQRRGRV